MMLPLHLFFQFFRTGLFSFGGGYATLPFLYDISKNYNWYSPQELSAVLAVSSVTPGPVGINMATFAGFITGGILGSVIATCAIVLPSLIIVSVVYTLMDKFKTNKYIKGILTSLKPAGCALLCSVCIKLMFTSNLHLLGLIFLVALISSSFVKKMDPIFYLAVSAGFGLVLGFMNLIGV